MSGDIAISRRSWRVFALLVAIALAGLATMLMAPIEQLLPPSIHVPRIALLANPAIIVILAAALGWWAAPQAGLDAPILGALADGGNAADPLSRAIVPALAGAVIGGLCIAGFELMSGPFMGGRAQAFEMPLVTRIFYGGALEELIFRWGIMSLVAAAALKLRARPVVALWIANVIAALLFGAGHVGNVMLTAHNAPLWLPAAVVLANTIVGMVCGWLFMRRGFEAAMIAHGLAHLVSAPLIALNA